MELQLFFDIIQDYLEQLHPNFCEEYIHNDNNDNITLFQICQEFFNQLGQQI